MSTPNIFIPKNQVAKQSTEVRPTPLIVLKLEAFVTRIMQGLIVALIGLFPVLFVPGVMHTTSFDKIIIFSVISGIVVICGSFLLLLRKQVSTVVPLSALSLLGVLAWGFASALVHDDRYDSLWGQQYEHLTVAFTGLLLISVLLPLLLQASSRMLVRVLTLVGFSFVIVLIHTFLRYWFGISWLDFGELTSLSQTLVGGFNDVAIYAALAVVMGLVTIIMLPLRIFAQVIVGILIVLALLILAIVHFSLLWHLLAVISGVTVLYVLFRRVLFVNAVVPEVSAIAKIVCVLVFLISLTFSVFGGGIANSIGQSVGTEFSEVRPSLTATVDVVRSVYQDSLWFGVGPNRFADAWREHKDLSINETVFWDTDFMVGHSFVASVFATHGLIGGVLLILFHLLFVRFGLLRLFRNVEQNIFARYVITLVFSGAVFLWVVSYMYTPSITLLLLAGFLTGLTYATSSVLVDTKIVTISAVTNRIRGFTFLILSVSVTATVCVLLSAAVNKYSAINTDPLTTSDDEVVALQADKDVVALRELISSTDPEELNQETLLESTRVALESANRSIELDPTNPVHIEHLAELYTLLGMIGVDGGYASAKDTYLQAIAADPKNPKYHLAIAQIELAEGDQDAAYKTLERALELKSNYTEAIQLQTDISIARGDVITAIDSVTTMTQLDPGNQVRFFQLGLLYAADGAVDNAIVALTRAINIDPTYADARYVRAIQYIAHNDNDTALAELYLVRETNPNNVELNTIISQLEAGQTDIAFPIHTPFDTTLPVVDSVNGVSVPSPVSTDLLAPVNTSGE